MSPRASLAALVLLALSHGACSSCERLGKGKRVVKVRWPASAPVELADHPLGDREGLDAREPAETTALAAPGIQVREGREAGLFFLEVVMGDAAFDSPLPLVMLLHGRGDRPRVPGGPFGHVPTPMRLVLPRAPTPLGNGFTWLSVSITQGQPEALARALVKRANHLAVFLQRVTDTRPVLGRPILAGFSQGAMLTYTYALLRPTSLVVAFPLVGWLPPSLLPPQGPSDDRAHESRPLIRSVHGTADPIIPIEPARELVHALKARSWAIELQEFEDVAHVMTPEMNATFETWLEAALAAEAPGLQGGLGEPGPEAETYEPYEDLEPETIEALEAQDLEARESEERPPQARDTDDQLHAPASDAGPVFDDQTDEGAERSP